MHRSGTSALTGLLHLLGVNLGSKLMAPSVENPRGYWEHEAIVGWHMGLLQVVESFPEDFWPLPEGWDQRPEVVPYYNFMEQLIHDEFDGKPIWGFKDPRACRLLPLWHTLFAGLQVQSAFILLVRNPDEVAGSLARRLGYPYNNSLLSALAHMLEAERHTRGRRRVVMTYDQLMADWMSQAQRVAAALDIVWPRSPQAVAPMAREFIDPALRHHGGSRAATVEYAIHTRGADPDIARCTFKVYELLTAAACGGAIDESEMDRIGQEFSQAVPALRAWRPRRTVAG